MKTINYYLMIINVIGLILYTINIYLYLPFLNNLIKKILPLISLIGGSGGILLAINLFDRKTTKDNAMQKIFTICILIIQLTIILIYNKYNLPISITKYLKAKNNIQIYLLSINITSFCLYGLDKLLALKNMWRIKITTLLLITFIGGSIGALIAMHLFKHKTNKNYFKFGVPLITIMHIFILILIINC